MCSNYPCTHAPYHVTCQKEIKTITYLESPTPCFLFTIQLLLGYSGEWRLSVDYMRGSFWPKSKMRPQNSSLLVNGRSKFWISVFKIPKRHNHSSAKSHLITYFGGINVSVECQFAWQCNATFVCVQMDTLNTNIEDAVTVWWFS